MDKPTQEFFSNDEIWTSLLKEVNQKVMAEMQSNDPTVNWPADIKLLKRPHFVDMQIVLEAFRSKNPKKISNIPGVETLERCFRYPEKKREKATRDCFSVYAGYTSYEAYKKRYMQMRPVRIQLSLAQSNVHIEFQGRIRELQKTFPHTISNQDFDTQDELIIRHITLYFFLVFDEFHVCQIISPNELGVLWKEFYSKGVIAALKRPAFRNRIIEMFKEEDDYTFFGLKEVFQAEIERLYRNSYGKELSKE